MELFGQNKIGFGTDLHVLVPGEGLMVGGVRIPCEYASLAVSDGDVLLHALVDALLGCAGLGDIGEHFPEDSVSPGESSRIFVGKTLAMLADAGLAVGNVDCVVDLERVRLSAWKPVIRESVAGMLGVAPCRVNVKAKTAEGLGPLGEGRAIAAQVVVLAVAAPPGEDG